MSATTDISILTKLITVNRNIDRLIEERNREQKVVLKICNAAINALGNISTGELTLKEAAAEATHALEIIEILVSDAE